MQVYTSGWYDSCIVIGVQLLCSGTPNVTLQPSFITIHAGYLMRQYTVSVAAVNSAGLDNALDKISRRVDMWE